MNPLAEFFASNINYTGAVPGSPPNSWKSDQELAGNDTQPKESTSQVLDSKRVCDRCIVKKVKCDMKQPACSRCAEVDAPCVYSVKKRKPGPVKGSKHARRKVSKDISQRTGGSDDLSPGPHHIADAPTSRASAWQKDAEFSQNGRPSGSMALTMASPSNVFHQSVLSPVVPFSIPSPLGIPPSNDQQRFLLDKFFLYIHPSIPMFHQQRFIARYEQGILSPQLLLAICVVTAKILGLSSSWNGSSLDDCTSYLLDLKLIESEGAGKILSLDNFRAACIIAFYAYHSHPGDRSWMRISTLTRKAYQCGLHQIDFHSPSLSFDPDVVTSGDLEEWRYVWWCIYCLDSYSNVAAVTPFVIEIESIKTALVTSSLTGLSSDIPSTSLRYLPEDTDALWKTAKEVSSSSGEINFNMHILTTTLIREAATIQRLRKQSTSKKLRTRLADLEDHFAAFRLALPPLYLTPTKNAFANESSSQHHARLICMLHIHLARTLTYFPINPQENEAHWTIRWQQSLECAEDIVSVVKLWPSDRFTATDPAICFIISLALTLLHLHSCAADVALEFKVRMDTQKDVLILYLEQFARVWTLPKFLITAFERFKRLVSGPLTPIELDRILNVALMPINYRWLNLLSLSADFDSLDNPERLYEDLFTQAWDSNEWDALLPIS